MREKEVEDRCPQCGSIHKEMRGDILDFNGQNYYLCADRWHDAAGKCPQCGSDREESK
jgi:formate dehydrogenase maturation protein FdhE